MNAVRFQISGTDVQIYAFLKEILQQIAGPSFNETHINLPKYVQSSIWALFYKLFVSSY